MSVVLTIRKVDDRYASIELDGESLEVGKDEALLVVLRWLDGGERPYSGWKKIASEEVCADASDGGPAFPVPADTDGEWADPVKCKDLIPYRGMSLRDYFAGQALIALVQKAPLFDAEGEHGPKFDKAVLQQFRKDMAESAYSYADWMLVARKS